MSKRKKRTYIVKRLYRIDPYGMFGRKRNQSPVTVVTESVERGRTIRDIYEQNGGIENPAVQSIRRSRRPYLARQAINENLHDNG